MTSDILEPIEIGLREGDVLECRYRVERLLSHGGMSSVYLGANDRLRRQVAIKVLHQVDILSADAVVRFENEAQAAGRIGSKHIVEVLDVGTTPRGESFLVMEYLDGETLKDRLERGPLTPGELVPIARQLLEGLGAAHAAGIVHLDLKPGNVFLMKERRGRARTSYAPGPAPKEGFELVKILDFGIARFQPIQGDPEKSIRTVMGTAHYMSPEQAVGERNLDGRTDLYAVGVILYRALTGRVPFSGTPMAEVLHRVVFERPPRPRDLAPQIDERFEAIIQKAMARDPEDRYRTAEEFASALASWQRLTEDDSATTVEPKCVVVPPLPQAPRATPSVVETATSWGTATSQPPAPRDREGPRMALVAAVACAFGTGALALVLTLSRAPARATDAPASVAAPPALVAAVQPAFATALRPIALPEPPAAVVAAAPKPARGRAISAAQPAPVAAPAPRSPVGPALARRPSDAKAAVEDYGY